jgi:transcriptional regulator with XRE-family HTH domain
MILDKNGKINGISQDEWKRLFARRLKDILNERNMSQSALARKSGLSVSRINDYLKMKSAPTIFAAVMMADALDMKVSDLICFDCLVHD